MERCAPDDSADGRAERGHSVSGGASVHSLFRRARPAVRTDTRQMSAVRYLLVRRALKRRLDPGPGRRRLAGQLDRTRAEPERARCLSFAPSERADHFGTVDVGLEGRCAMRSAARRGARPPGCAHRARRSSRTASGTLRRAFGSCERAVTDGSRRGVEMAATRRNREKDGRSTTAGEGASETQAGTDTQRA
ncbi:hypothetical protein TRVL_06279 [Trypanosoma vivax]|nr:hypothetical protein TRVL_06279 [Trypanosoma vivax]